MEAGVLPTRNGGQKGLGATQGPAWHQEWKPGWLIQEQ